MSNADTPNGETQMFAEVTQHEWNWPEAFAFVGCFAAIAAVAIVFILRASED